MSELIQDELPFPPSTKQEVDSAINHARLRASELAAPADSAKEQAVILTDLTQSQLDNGQLKTAVEIVSSTEADRRRRLRAVTLSLVAREQHRDRVKRLSGTVIGRHTLALPRPSGYPLPEKRRYDD